MVLFHLFLIVDLLDDVECALGWQGHIPTLLWRQLLNNLLHNLAIVRFDAWQAELL